MQKLFQKRRILRKPKTTDQRLIRSNLWYLYNVVLAIFYTDVFYAPCIPPFRPPDTSYREVRSPTGRVRLGRRQRHLRRNTERHGRFFLIEGRNLPQMQQRSRQHRYGNLQHCGNGTNQSCLFRRNLAIVPNARHQCRKDFLFQCRTSLRQYAKRSIKLDGSIFKR